MNGSLRWVLVVVVLALSCKEPPPEASPALSSRVELAAGNVWLAGKQGNTRLITGAMLPARATVAVGQGSRALIRLDSGALVFLRSDSEIAIEASAVKLVKGELWADMPAEERETGKLAAGPVSISASDAGVDVAFDGKEARIYVARGLAVVAAPGGRAEVGSGERASVSGNAKPRVEPVGFWEDWTGGMADNAFKSNMESASSGQLYGIDPSAPGASPQQLQISSQNVDVAIRDGIAFTTVDQRFFNPSSTPLEGWYWFTIPEGAAVERFALEVNGSLVDGEMVERKQAAAAYENEVQQQFDPALLEWVDGRTFRARIYPIGATGERRVVLSYSELLPLNDNGYRYVYPMAAGGAAVTVQEFALKVRLGDQGKDYSIATLQDATVSVDGASVSMRRSGFRPRADFLLELKPKKSPDAMRVVRFNASDNEADYVMVRYMPQVEWQKLDKVAGEVVVVMDTSAGGDEADRQVRADAVEAILRALSSEDKFAVIAADLEPRTVYPPQGLSKADPQSVSAAVAKLAEVPSAGATDLGKIFSAAFDLLDKSEQPAVVYVGDGLATVGETSSDELADRLRRALGNTRARLFTIAVGAEAASPLMERLARVGGGHAFTIATPEQAVQEALRFVGMVKTPTITDFQIDVGRGLDQAYTTASGKVSEGQEVIVLGRTHHDLPKTITVKGRLGGKPMGDKVYPTEIKSGSAYAYVPALWARQYLSRLMGDGLEQNKGRIISLGLGYSLMTPLTSFLVLENDDAYRRHGIERRSRRRFSMVSETHPNAGLIASIAASVPFAIMGCTKADTSEQAAPTEAPSVVSAPSARYKSEAPSDNAVSGGLGAADMARKEQAPSRRADEEGALGSPEAKSAPSPQRAALAEPSDPLKGLDDRDFSPKDRASAEGSGRGGARDEVQMVAKPDNPFQKPQIAADAPVFVTGICSDASTRSLRQRRVLWQRRLEQVQQPDQYVRLFFEAGERCELPNWQDRKALLDLIEQRASSPSIAQGLLQSFAKYPKLESYLRLRLIRRALDPDRSFAFAFAGPVDWNAIQVGLIAYRTPAAKLQRIRAILDKYPNEIIGRQILVELLVQSGMKQEGLAEISRLRREGVLSPAILEIACDLQAEQGREQEAQRTCSELVEFNAADPEARRRLGDLFMRHRWYPEAYRQYTSLTAMSTNNPRALLRLAAAAAGIGKGDEALRIERKVASSEGDPGPDDPRRIAKLHSAARLGAMMLAARQNDHPDEFLGLERSLKRVQVVGEKNALVLLIWEDFSVSLELTPTQAGQSVPVSDRVASPDTGLLMLDLGPSLPDNLELVVKPKQGTVVNRKVPYTIVTIVWDGKTFTVEQRSETLMPQV